MRAPFPIQNSSRPQSKVCGLTCLEDALACARNGINAIGINFWPQSKRYHAFTAASQWLASVPDAMTRVAVFVNASADEVARMAQSGLIDVLQFHGDESDEFVQQFIDAGHSVIRAVSVRNEADLKKIESSPAASILLDAYDPTQYGGTGKTCDWKLAARAVREFPDKLIILSGGLTPANIPAALREVEPCAIDVASGVEISPGKKSQPLIEQLAQAVQAHPQKASSS